MSPSKAPLYVAWYGMLHRCQSPSSRLYKYYGGRGITVCERWQAYRHFAEDMGEKPAPGHGATLERIDNNGNYEPGNVKWATMKEQGLNTRKVKLLKVGSVTDSIRGWAKRLGVSRQAIMSRMRKGWDAQRTIETPFCGSRGSAMHKSFNPAILERQRLLRGLTVAELAKRVGKGPSAVWFTLRGKSASPPVVRALCLELGVNPEHVWRKR